MHVLVLPSWYPTEEDPINGSFFREQAKALARSGCRVSVFARRQEARRGARIQKTVSGPFTEYVIRYRPFRFSYFYVLMIMARLLRTELRGERVDIIHVHSAAAGRYARGLKFLFRIPYVITEHSSRLKSLEISPREARALRRSYNGASAVLSVSEGLKAYVEKYTDRPVMVIPNMVDARFFDAPLRPARTRPFRYLFVGGLNAAKGLDTLLEAYAAVRRTLPDTELVLCGDGEERTRLESRAGELGLRDGVVFRGAVTREECVEEMENAGALILPSRTETFGVVCAEALACGRPIVMTKTDAWRSLIAPDTGLAVEIGDAEGLARAMAEICREYDRYGPAVLRAYAAERFSEETVCRRLSALYAEILNR